MSINRTVENVYIRQRAVERTRQHFWRLLGMTVMISIITSVLNGIFSAVGNRLMRPELTEVIDQYAYLTTSTRLTSSEPLLNATIELFTSPKFILFSLVCSVLTGIVSAGLTLGHDQQLIEAARGLRPQPLAIFSSMKRCLKAWGLQLWAGLFMGLWFLPGLIVILIGGGLANGSISEASNLVMTIGMVLMLVLEFRAVLRYAMAHYLLAEHPSWSVRDCLKTSISRMQGRLWQFFKVGFPVFFKILGAVMVATIVYNAITTLVPMDSQLASVVETVLVFIATAYFSEQFNLVYAVFYLNTQMPVLPENAPRPVSEWLPEPAVPVAAEPAAESPITPAESTPDSPEDTTPDTNEAKENDQ